jgi:hypothetical protein
MSQKMALTFLIALGIVLDVVGLSLPWVEGSWAPGVYLLPSYLLGIDVPLGVFAFVGWLVATVSWMLFMIKGQKLSLGFVMAGGIVTMICSLVSIVNPGAFLSSSQVYTASYGEYVCFSGGTLILVGATLILRLGIQPIYKPITNT